MIILIIDNIGWLGALMLSICGLPQAIHSYKHKNSDGITWAMLHLWFWGEIGQLIYVIYYLKYPIIFNCSLNIIIILVMIYYKAYPKR